MSGTSRMSRRKKLCFAGIATVGFFLLTEAALVILRISPRTATEDPYVGFSSWLPLFVKQTDDNDEVIMKTAENKIHLFNPQEFPKAKPARTFRMFCLGGSTTYGRPYDDRTSFAGWLREFLPDADQSKHWEVINAGGISYASYRVARLMEELAAYEPDLFIIYSGHNEFLERRTYGSLAETPAAVQTLDSILSQTRTYTLLRNVIKGSDEDNRKSKAILPAEVNAILDRSIGPEAYKRDDALRDQVVRHYEVNLNRMIDIAKNAGAKVLFVTPASNIRDFSPFKSQFGSGAAPADRQRILGWLSAADEALANGSPDAALRLVDQALQLDNRFAEAWFLRGRGLWAQEKFGIAREAFLRARDEDVCPLRALSAICEATRKTAHKRNIPLVDFVEIVEQRSDHNIPGNTLFLDHVHPTIAGHKMLALAIVEALATAEMITPGESWNEQTIERIANRVREGIDPEAHARSLVNLSKVLGWAGKQAESSRLALKAVDMLSGDLEAQYEAGNACFVEGRLDDAERFYQNASKINERYAPARYGLGLVASARGKHAEAAEHCRAALALDPSFSEARFVLGHSLMELKDYAGASRQFREMIRLTPGNRHAYNKLGLIEAIGGNLDGAKSWFERALEVDPAFAEAHVNLGHVFEDQGDKAKAIEHYRAALRQDPNHPQASQSLSRLGQK